MKECLAQEYTVDWGNSFGERTAYIKTPMRIEDFDEGEEHMFLTENYIKANITLETTHTLENAIRVKASFQLLKSEPTLDVTAIVDVRGLAYDAKELANTKEKLVAILVHKVKTYYEGKGIDIKSIKEEKKMPGLMHCDEICEYLGIQKKTPDNRPKWNNGLPAVDKVETYNNRVVKVTFIDGTYTKAVCSENDNFDLDMGITICAMKRLLGTNSENATREYNRFINHVHSVMEKNTLKELAEEAQKAKEKSKQRKAELKRAAKKLKAKEEQIDIQKQAIIRAQKELEAEDQ